MTNTIEVSKIKPLLQKNKFYDFFIDYVTSHDSMKREISEIVAENRKLTIERALNIRNFRIKEVEKFIISNDLESYF